MVVSRFLAWFRRLFYSSSGESLHASIASTQEATHDENARQEPAPILEGERVSRFVLDKRHLKADVIKFRAFEPPSADTALSVTRSEGLSEADLWAHGDRWVAAPANREVVARGDFTPAQARAVTFDGFQLAIVADEPPPRHANVIGWPPVEQKEVRRSLAQQLAALAHCVVRPQ